MIQFTTKAIRPKNSRQKGRDSIFNIGFIVTFIIPKINQPNNNVFHISTQVGEIIIQGDTMSFHDIKNHNT